MSFIPSRTLRWWSRTRSLSEPRAATSGLAASLAAFDVHTGKEVWRFHTIPQPGEPGHETWAGDSWKHGGAAIWNTGAYDPETNLTFWGTGNPAPDWDGRKRAGDNLYSDSVLALDADTGKLKWFYQFTPHDELDYDSTQVPVLADIDWQGAPRKVMLWANRNGLMYVLDRNTGQFLMGKPFTTGELDVRASTRKAGPCACPAKCQRLTAAPSCPRFWAAPTGIRLPTARAPVGSTFRCGRTREPSRLKAGARRPPETLPWARSICRPTLKLEEEGYGAVGAFDPKTGERKWEFKMNDITWAGVLTTESDLSVQRRTRRLLLRAWTTAPASCCGRHRWAARSTAGR